MWASPIEHGPAASCTDQEHQVVRLLAELQDVVGLLEHARPQQGVGKVQGLTRGDEVLFVANRLGECLHALGLAIWVSACHAAFRTES